MMIDEIIDNIIERSDIHRSLVDVTPTIAWNSFIRALINDGYIKSHKEIERWIKERFDTD